MPHPRNRLTRSSTDEAQKPVRVLHADVCRMQVTIAVVDRPCQLLVVQVAHAQTAAQCHDLQVNHRLSL